MKEIVVYLHNNCSRGELQEIYNLTEHQADKLHDIIYEVGIRVNLRNGKMELENE